MQSLNPQTPPQRTNKGLSRILSKFDNQHAFKYLRIITRVRAHARLNYDERYDSRRS